MRTTLLDDRPRSGKWGKIIQQSWNTMPLSIVVMGGWQIYLHPDYAEPYVGMGVAIVAVMITMCCLRWLAETFEIRRRQ